MQSVDITIVGAGVVGLALAYELSALGKSIVVLERNDSFGLETSSRNSEVIHAGMYYPSGTLKAKLCVQGNRMLYDFCARNKIRHNKIGKFIIATDKQDFSTLEKLLKQGQNNGVEGLIMMDRRQIQKFEPNVEALMGLFSPSTGILDTHQFMDCLHTKAKDKGVMMAYQCEVQKIEYVDGEYTLSVKNNEAQETFRSRIVINAAGLDSDLVAQAAGLDIDQMHYRLHFCRGQYFRVAAEKAKMIRRLIYPAPKPSRGGLGIHATLDLAGGLRLGPDDEYLTTRDKNYNLDESKKRDFYHSAKIFLPFLNEADLSGDTVGIRPKLHGPDEEFRDFVIREEDDHGLRRLINLIGIESPGFTAALAIAGFVRQIVRVII